MSMGYLFEMAWDLDDITAFFYGWVLDNTGVGLGTSKAFSAWGFFCHSIKSLIGVVNSIAFT